MKRILQAIVFTLIVVTFANTANAQNFGINTASPDPSAALDVKSYTGLNQGILPTFVDLATATFPSPGPANGLLVHNTNASYGLGVGIYQNIGTTTSPVWVKQITKNDAWGISGNTGTTPGTHFIGTTDNKDVIMKRNSVGATDQFLQLTSQGLGIGASSPTDNTNSGKSLFFGQTANITGTSGIDVGIDQDNNSVNSNFRIIKDGGTELMRVQEDGSVGINQPSPSEKLDIKDGNIKLSTTTQNQKTSGQIQFTAGGISTTTKMVVVRKTLSLTTSSTSISANIFDDGYIKFGVYYSGSRWALMASPVSSATFDYNYVGNTEHNAGSYYYTNDALNNYEWTLSNGLAMTSGTFYEIAGVTQNSTWGHAAGGHGAIYGEGTTTTNPFYEFDFFVSKTSTTTQRLVTVIIKAYY